MKVKLNGLKISHIATSLPKKIVYMRDYEEFFSAKDIKRIIESTGVESVHVSETDKCTSDYYVATAKKLLEASGLTTEDFDGVVAVLQTPDYILPTTATILQDRIGLPQSCVAFEINYGCTGYIYALYQAALLVSSGSCKRVLAFVGDTHVRTVHEEDRANKMILGDGFAVTVVERGTDEMTFQIMSDGSGYKHLIIEAGSFRIPKSEKTSVPFVDENGNTHWLENLYMDGMEIMNFALKRVPPLVKDSLAYVGWDKDSVGAFVFHQANELILRFLRKRIGIDVARFPIEMKNIGNTAGATIPLTLSLHYDELMKRNALEKVLLCGFGVGLALGTVTANLSNTKFYGPWEF